MAGTKFNPQLAADYYNQNGLQLAGHKKSKNRQSKQGQKFEWVSKKRATKKQDFLKSFQVGKEINGSHHHQELQQNPPREIQQKRPSKPFKQVNPFQSPMGAKKQFQKQQANASKQAALSQLQKMSRNQNAQAKHTAQGFKPEFAKDQCGRALHQNVKPKVKEEEKEKRVQKIKVRVTECRQEGTKLFKRKSFNEVAQK